MYTKPYDRLPGLMTLKSFLTSGYDLGEGKIMVCVRSVGLRRTIYSKRKDSTFDLVEVNVCDDSAHYILKIWEDKIPSVKLWALNHTILLISKPSCYTGDRTVGSGSRHAGVSIGYSSIVDVDPDFPESIWLPTRIQDMAKRAGVIVPFLKDTWDIQVAIYGPDRALYTLAELEDQIRNQDPASNFTGKLSVIVLEMMGHWRKATAYCTECYGIPLYANRATAICKNCDCQRNLSLNPRILSSFLDESGMAIGNRPVWNDSAWTQFIFAGATQNLPVVRGQKDDIKRLVQNIAKLDVNFLRDVEAQLLYSRVTLTFGWSIELERLCILGVEW
ncbi:hypothetical protein SAMD00023353_9000280 [Rosellinia necatrix]|uniref:Uncharacterized protein n=1 Tax=Rosellinia necatrix TaxID=77044 RepID=A0A1W2TW29_ROSNE|nr:hypothetical protein SAMD00023353_9000280 [Rosellinia necatrix]